MIHRAGENNNSFGSLTTLDFDATFHPDANSPGARCVARGADIQEGNAR
jgi:hypothetical protein